MYSYCFDVQQHYFPRLCHNAFLQTTILPIPKLKSGTAVSSDNYCGMALSSVFGKLFDNIVLHRYHEMLCTSDLQFGFKKKSSTNLCTRVLKEPISSAI